MIDRPFILGIDPGQTTGLAGYDPDAHAFAFVGSAPPLVAVQRLRAWAERGVLLAAILEDSRSLPIFNRYRDKNRGERDRVARSVGRVDALTDLYLEVLHGLDVPVTCAEPVRAAKWDADTLGRLTGYAARSNVHGRDAARLVWGRRQSGARRPLAEGAP